MNVYAVYLETPNKTSVRRVVVAKDLLGVHRTLKESGLVTSVSAVNRTEVDAILDKRAVQ